MNKKELKQLLSNLKELRNKYYRYLNNSDNELTTCFYMNEIEKLTDKIIDILDCLKSF